MAENLYEYALMRDPVGAQMIMIALEDGEIDRAAAVLAWRICGGRKTTCGASWAIRGL